MEIHINTLDCYKLIMKGAIIRDVKLNGRTVRIREPKASISIEKFLKEIEPVLRKIKLSHIT